MILYYCMVPKKKSTMKTQTNSVVNCKLNGKSLRVTGNSVEIEDSILQIELVKRLIDCRALTPIGESPLPTFFNKYLRKYQITEVLFSEERPAFMFEPEFDDFYIDNMIEGMAA